MATQTEELKLVISAEQKAEREIDRLTKKLTDFKANINKAFDVPAISRSLNNKAVAEAFTKYGKGLSQINDRYTRWAQNERRMGRMSHENWQLLNKQLDAYIRKNGEVRKLNDKQQGHFIDLVRRLRAYEQAWSQQHSRYLSAKRREGEIEAQLSRAKDRLANLGFVEEKRRRSNIDALDRQRSRAYLADLKRRESAERALGNQRSAEYLRQLRRDEVARQRAARLSETATRSLDRQRSNAYLADLRRRESAERALGNQRSAAYLKQLRSEEVERRRAERARASAEASLDRQRSQAFLAEERRRQRLKINSWAMQMRQDEAARRAADRADQAAVRDRQHRWNNRAQAAMGIPGNIIQGTTSVAIVGGIVEAALAKAVESVFATRRSTDRAETNLMMFGGLDRAGVNRARTEWLDRAAMANAFSPSAAINAYTETLKAGIPDAVAPAVTQSIMGAAAGMDLNVADTTKLVGRLSTLTQDPKAFDPKAIDNYLNAIAVVAKVTAADTNELVSSLRRGAGALGSSRMSVGDLTAFTGVGISAGMQEGKAGTFMDFTVNELVNARNSRGQRRADLQKGLQLAGLGSLSNVTRQMASNPTDMLLKLFEKMSSVSPEKAGQIASLIFMREWRGEALQMAKASPMLRRTVEAERSDPTNSHLRNAKELSLGSLDGLMRQWNAVFAQVKDALGKGLEPTFRQITGFLIEFGQGINFKTVQEHVESLIEGFTSGLGFGSVPEILEGLFGKPGEFNTDTLGKWLLFGRGLGKGIREFIDTLRTSLPTFGAETLGLWTTRLLAWSQAIQVMRPAFDLLGTLFTTLGNVLMVLAGSSVLKTLITAFAGAGAGAGAGAAGGGGLAALLGTISGGMIAVSIGAISSMALASWWGWKNPSLSGVPDEKKSPIEKKPEDRQWWEMIPGMPGFDRMNYQGEQGTRGLIHRASSTSFDKNEAAIDRLATTVRSMGAQFQLAALGGGMGRGVAAAMGGGGGSFGLGGGGAGGGGGDPATKFGKNFFTPEGMKVPDWYGKGGGGSASSNPANSATSAAMLDAIAGTESGKAGYDAVLGNGKYGMPSKPISQMSIDEAFAFGRQVRARHGSSSALGRYQIVGRTMRAAQKALGIPGNAIFDGPMQDRMARWIARNQGLGAWEGLKHNPAAMARARAALAAGGARDSSSAEAAAAIPNASGMTHPLGGLGRFTSGFGMRIHPLTGRPKMHDGIDLAAQAGTAVKAMKEGVVAIDRSGDVTVKHPDGSSTTYRHVVPGVRSGQNVATGQMIARLRAHDPRSTGPHLHLESRDAQGRLRNPMGLLQAIEKAGSVPSSRPGFPAIPVSPKVGQAGELASSGWKPGGPSIGDGMTSSGWKAVPPDARKFYGTGWKTPEQLYAEKLGGEWRKGGQKVMGKRMMKLWQANKLPAPPQRPDGLFTSAERAVESVKAVTEAGRKANSSRITPAGAGTGFQAPAASGGGATGNVPRKDRAISRVPLPPRREAGAGGGAGGVSIVQHIHGAGQSPEEVANLAQRKISMDWNHRSHELEPEVT
ncbi:peptidoglycan DD-metalloendopeptidase family protein [uncultured Methylobacterium sp.]|jgi:murein DD-endopeptidase MepM/ murein hydrolase activator NlpD|uniref:peptidoglycan DD-metalloendopeptidase family protein n=1 Tax=uncultured Methylobacterium sp. TaxID=157278 RepID=UPI002612AA1C|nr:peptidoglycan DD-metalloendopeptidase family protein [uncultured Methylobacterium sp.]